MANIGYVRVSTEEQDIKNQELRVYEYALMGNIKVDRMVRETISTRKADRKIFGLVEELKPGDKLITTELSRLGRSGVAEVYKLIQQVRDRGAELHVISDNLIVTPGDMSVQAEAIIFALSLSAKIEREMISMRTKNALQARKAQGVKLGRPEGKSKLDEHKEK